MGDQSHIVVIGAGPAGLMAAEVCARGGARVSVCDRMPSAGRKFLLAGRGGLNLTHSDDFDRLLSRYRGRADELRPALEAFPPSALRGWCEDLGQPTFVGSSGRVFPAAFKASPLLRAWLRRLATLGVVFKPRHRWTGWNGGACFATPTGPVALAADATILALGGASWPHLGADGGWVDGLKSSGIAVAPLAPTNCGVLIEWTELVRTRFAGQPLKGIALSLGEETARGETIITQTGLEGGALYALSAPLREAISARGDALLHIALRPDFAAAALQERFTLRPHRQSLATFLRKAIKLSPAAIALVHEVGLRTGEPLSAMDPADAAARLNALPLRVTGIAPLARAISTAGGVRFDELDESFMLKRRPGTFAAGEMLDWEAPTGGYLLQACFATGVAAGRGALAWAARVRESDTS